MSFSDNPYRPPEEDGQIPIHDVAVSDNMKQARFILLWIGAVGLAFSLYNLSNIPPDGNRPAPKRIAIPRRPPIAVEPAEEAATRERTRFLRQTFFEIQASVGVLLIIFGLLVKRYPVPITIAGLVVYIASELLEILFVPSTLFTMSSLFRIVIVVAFYRAIQSALATQREIEIYREWQL